MSAQNRGILLTSVGVLLAAGPVSGPAFAHVEADGLIVSQGSQTLVHVWQGAVTGSIEVPYLGPTAPLDVLFISPDSVLFEPQPPETTWLKHLFTAPGTAQYDSLGSWSFALTGLTAGANANILLRIWYSNHYDFTSPNIPYHVANPVAAPHAAAALMRLDVWPNPMAAAGEVRYALASADEVQLSLHDASGRLVRLLDHGVRTAGLHRVTLTGSGLPSGVYFVRLSTDGEATSRKVAILR
jgi:hypothetical protein